MTQAQQAITDALRTASRERQTKETTTIGAFMTEQPMARVNNDGNRGFTVHAICPLCDVNHPKKQHIAASVVASANQQHIEVGWPCPYAPLSKRKDGRIPSCVVRIPVATLRGHPSVIAVPIHVGG